MHAMLTDRAVISLSGDDAREFLQGLISNDVRKLEDGQMIYAALLSPQGKFLHDFFVLLRGGVFYLDVDASRAADLLQRLNIYKLRSKVSINLENKLRVAASWGGGGNGISDPRLPQLGYRIIGEVLAEGADDYERHRLELGIPDGAKDMLFDKSLLLEFGFEDLHGVDFNKGCYVGQEVTARSKHRGQVRKFIYQVHANAALPPAGTPIFLGDAESGQMRSSRGNIGLAILRVMDVDAAQKSNKEFHSGNVMLKASLPQWVIHKPSPE